MTDIMRRLERSISKQYPEVACGIREEYYHWNLRTRKEITHWHEEVLNINGFLNWLLLDELGQMDHDAKLEYRSSVFTARKALNNIESPDNVEHWINNLMDRYFPTYADMVA